MRPLFLGTAQEVAHSLAENKVVDAPQATSLVACGRVRKKLRRGAQLLAHFCFVIGFGVRSNLLFYFLSY